MASHDGKLVQLTGPASAYATEAVSAANLKAILGDPKVLLELEALILRHTGSPVGHLDLTSLAARINAIT